MGYAFNENHRKNKLHGEVVYRKRNIRLQNRQLKMKLNQAKPVDEYTYSDVNSDELTNSHNKVIDDLKMLTQ